MSKTSPFKFLDAYNKADKDIFFGRNDEVEKLYELVFQSNLTLVYGQSGTGKTSLVQCGLANRFAQSDWFNIYIRRNEDINESLLDTLKKYRIPQTQSSHLLQRLKQKRRRIKTRTATLAPENKALTDLTQTLEGLYKHYLKPIYLIFDQFEELYILGNKSEEKSFYQNIANILQQLPYCHVIIIMREEHIAQLYDFEKVVEHLFDKRLRVEPMSRATTEDVIIRTTDEFGIKLENTAVPGKIIDALSEGQGRVELTYLQVFLDRLYQEAEAIGHSPITYTTGLIQKIGSISDVLRDFLSRQTSNIQQDLMTQYPRVPTNAVAKTLSTFVSVEGTKRPLTKGQINSRHLSIEQVEFIVQQLGKARIIRFENEHYELSHDTLAQQIHDQRSADEKSLLQIAKMVQDRYSAYATTKTPLQSGELVLVDNFKPLLKEENSLSQQEWAFVDKSVQEKRKKQIRVGSLVVAIFLILIAFSVYSNRLKAAAEKNLEDLREANYNTFFEAGNANMSRNDYEQAINNYQEAIKIDSTQQKAKDSIAVAEQKAAVFIPFERYKHLGDSLVELNDGKRWIDAFSWYQQARALEYDNSADDKANKIIGNITKALEDFKNAGDNLYRADRNVGYINALKNYQEAARIQDTLQKYRPDIPIRDKKIVEKRIRDCERKLKQ